MNGLEELGRCVTNDESNKFASFSTNCSTSYGACPTQWVIPNNVLSIADPDADATYELCTPNRELSSCRRSSSRCSPPCQTCTTNKPCSRHPTVPGFLCTRSLNCAPLISSTHAPLSMVAITGNVMPSFTICLFGPTVSSKYHWTYKWSSSSVKLMQNSSNPFCPYADMRGVAPVREMHVVPAGPRVWYPAWSRRMICVEGRGSFELGASL